MYCMLFLGTPVPPRTKGAPPMNTTTTPTNEKLHQLIDKMDEYQTELVLSFLETLFDLDLDLAD